uniref:Tail protein n=1 Tax=Siphoviridae sp. cthL03 TaxID=2825615 RepID=A0A8S5PGQ2_9CAUD|nr:BppU family phage baseplate upper protein [uncultured Lachnoclostridium sp.]DAE05627.1 MAG TPA: tail protein [Siphoviridae sp. cthL03]
MKPYNIELSTERNQPVETNIKLCQGDNNITFNINISDFDLTGNTVKIVFTQSNGISVENSAIVNSDNKSCTYNIVGNELQSVGKVVADLKIYDSNNKRLSSACFIFYVELDSLSDGSFPPKSYSASLEKALEECKEATQAALDAVQKVVNIANNDAVTVEGFAWDARRGKAIRDDFNALNESLPYIALDGTSYTSLYSCIADMKNNSHPIIISWSPKNDFPVLWGGRWTFEVSKYDSIDFNQIIATYKGDNENPNLLRIWIGKIMYNSTTIIWEELSKSSKKYGIELYNGFTISDNNHGVWVDNDFIDVYFSVNGTFSLNGVIELGRLDNSVINMIPNPRKFNQGAITAYADDARTYSIFGYINPDGVIIIHLYGAYAPVKVTGYIRIPIK